MKSKNLPKLRERLTGNIDRKPADVNIFSQDIENKWRNIPIEVKDAYWKEYYELQDEMFRNRPVSKGLMYYLLHPIEMDNHTNILIQYGKMIEKKVKELHDKHFGPYDLNRKNLESESE